MSDATLAPPARRFRAATDESPWVRWTLIAIGAGGLVILVFAPLFAVFGIAAAWFITKFDFRGKLS